MGVPIFIWFLVVLLYCIIATNVKCEILGVERRLSEEPSKNRKLAIKIGALVWPITIPCMLIVATILRFFDDGVDE